MLSLLQANKWYICLINKHSVYGILKNLYYNHTQEFKLI